MFHLMLKINISFILGFSLIGLTSKKMYDTIYIVGIVNNDTYGRGARVRRNPLHGIWGGFKSHCVYNVTIEYMISLVTDNYIENCMP